MHMLELRQKSTPDDWFASMYTYEAEMTIQTRKN
jgi:hypothetical protein